MSLLAIYTHVMRTQIGCVVNEVYKNNTISSAAHLGPSQAMCTVAYASSHSQNACPVYPADSAMSSNCVPLAALLASILLVHGSASWLPGGRRRVSFSIVVALRLVSEAAPSTLLAECSLGVSYGGLTRTGRHFC